MNSVRKYMTDKKLAASSTLLINHNVRLLILCETIMNLHVVNYLQCL